MTRWAILAAVAVAASAPAFARPSDVRAVDAALKRAEELANAGRADDALAAASEAVAIAGRLRPADPEQRFLALRAETMLAIPRDQQSAPRRLAALAAAAEQAYGRDGFQTVFARFKLAQWSYFNKAGGVTLADLAAAADAVVAPAKTDEERTLAAVALAVLANETSLTDVAAAQPPAARAVALADGLGNESAERGSVYNYAATVALRSDRPGEAAAFADRAIAIFESDQGARSTNIVSALGTKANAVRQLGDPGAADALLRRTVTIVDGSPQVNPQFRARTYFDYARFLASRGQHALALAMIERAVSEATSLPTTGTLVQAIALSAGRIALDAGRHEAALGHFRRALAMTLSATMRATTLTELGRTELALGDIAAAQASAERALAAAEAAAPAGHSLRGAARLLLADVAAARGEGRAAELYRSAAADLAGTGAVATQRATADLRRAALLAGQGAVDAAEWRRSRAAADLLAGGLARAAADARSEGATLALPAPLVDAALDLAWVRGRQLGRR